MSYAIHVVMSVNPRRIRIEVNGIPTDTEHSTLSALRNEMFPGRDVMIINGHCVADSELRENDKVHISTRNRFPDKDELEALMSARHTPKVHEKVRASIVGIAGLGGLGSNIAVMLARLGIGHLVIADFDTVEPTNLNRQNYYIEHIGLNKTDAMKSLIEQINPFVKVTAHAVRLNEKNIPKIFKDCSIVCEAFDSASEKTMLVNTISQKLPDVDVIMGSGLAGHFDSNTIRTEKKTDKIYICGDGVSDAKPGSGLMAPRVGICAGHMANAVLRLITGEM